MCADPMDKEALGMCTHAMVLPGMVIWISYSGFDLKSPNLIIRIKKAMILNTMILYCDALMCCCPYKCSCSWFVATRMINPENFICQYSSFQLTYAMMAMNIAPFYPYIMVFIISSSSLHKEVYNIYIYITQKEGLE